MRRRVAELEAIVRDLQAQLGRHAANSSLPPSANPPSAPKPVVKEPTGRAPGGKSRWTGREREPIAFRPELVVEVAVDHITDQYFRHGSRLLRWRIDKNPRDCTMDQLRSASPFSRRDRLAPAEPSRR